jgi:kynurenine formamidase
MRNGRIWRRGVIGLSIILLSSGSYAETPQEPSLLPIYQTLHSKRFVDLTHAFAPGIPHWKGLGDEQVKVLYDYDKGFLIQEFTHPGQWGTHVDPPAHFHKGLRTVDQIPLDQMLLPLVVIDIHEKVAKNPDTTVTLDDLHTWEKRHGPIPEGAFVALRTDWSKRWPGGEDAMENVDAKGIAHYPGWSKPVLQYLYEQRKITASGHETTDTDPGLATSKDDYSLESYILGLNHYQIELLANLDQVPESGALVMVSFPKPKDGTGFPARVIAILP